MERRLARYKKIIEIYLNKVSRVAMASRAKNFHDEATIALFEKKAYEGVSVSIKSYRAAVKQYKRLFKKFCASRAGKPAFQKRGTNGKLFIRTLRRYLYLQSRRFPAPSKQFASNKKLQRKLKFFVACVRPTKKYDRKVTQRLALRSGIVDGRFQDDLVLNRDAYQLS